MKVQKKEPLISTFVIIITMMTLMGMFGLLCQWLLRDCILWTCAPPRSFAILGLDISLELFPDDAGSGVFSQPSELNGAIEAASKSIGWDGGRAYYLVQRFSTENRADNEFESIIPNTVDYLSYQTRDIKDLSADGSVIQCGNMVFGPYRCYFIGRYQEYVILFFADIDISMAEEDFRQIVHVIDNQITCKLNENCVLE